jgi:ankyrin repeat protein
MVFSADIHYKNCYGDTVLTFATFFGKTDIVKLLLDKGVAKQHLTPKVFSANVNDASYDNNTALINASCQNHVDIVKLLLNKGANVYAANEQGHTAYTITNDPEILKLFCLKTVIDYLKEGDLVKVFELCKLNITYK